MRGFLGVALACLCIPLVAAAGGIAWIAAAEGAGSRPFAPPAYRNSAEAAAAADAAAMLRLIRMGDDPTRVHPICCELISSQVRYATTVEAALWSRRIEAVRLLDREGAIFDPAERRHLACLAADLDMREVAEYLAPGHSCVRNEAMQRVLARSKEASATND